MTLADFQDAFARALLADDAGVASPDIAHLVAQPGFAVYRNTVLKGCIDALHANFPAVAQIVGDEWLRAAAAVYVRRELPTAPMLIDYGRSFPDFLASFEPAAELTYLADVARVDRLWSEAHAAADEPLLDAAALGGLATDDMRRTGLQLHAAARWLWCDEHPVYTLWTRNRPPERNDAAAIEWRGEGILLTRPRGAVERSSLSRAGAALLSACAQHRCIDDAVAAALNADPGADLSALFGTLIHAGAFSGLRPIHPEANPR
jgi:hypothetical protein